MTDRISLSTAQLKETCKATGARWATWLVHNNGNWEFSSRHGLSKARQAVLVDFLTEPATATWLAGTFSSGRTRFRQTGAFSAGLNCARVFVFPELSRHYVLVVGADRLEKFAESFFKVLSAYPPIVEPIPSSPASSVESPPPRRARRSKETAKARLAREEALKLASGEALFYATSTPEDVPRMVLDFLAQSVRCDSAIMSLRSGDIFRVEAVWNAPSSSLGIGLQIGDNEILAEMANSRQGIILDAVTTNSNDKTLSHLYPNFDKKINSWMGIPIVIGQRVIGHLAFVSSKLGFFSTNDLKLVSKEMTRLAYALENAIVFSEAARYLQQFALLNELASTASVGGDINDVARRIMGRLRKTFRTEIAGVLMLDGDTSLREYGADADHGIIFSLAKTKLVRGVIKTGRPIRVGEIQEERDFGQQAQETTDIRSILAVPLKYRGAVLGVLVMANTESNSFNLEDEQLLVVIASQLAGLFENVRLNQETRERVRNLTLIHQVVENVLGLTDIEEIAHVVADLMVKRFAYASASVILMDEKGERRRAIRETKAPQPAKQKRSKRNKEAASSNARVSMDQLRQVSGSTEEQIFEIQAASSICVPLKEGDHILGVIEVERRRQAAFSENDLLALEALAGVLSSVVLSALRYQELQERIEAQRRTEGHLVRSAKLAAVGEMAAGVAHELNSPLTSVSGFAELLLKEMSIDSPHRPKLELVLQEAQRASGVVRRLLDFSRQSDNRRTNTDANKLCSEVLALVTHLAQMNQVEVVCEYGQDLPLVSTDANQIKQVLLNLLHNAIQAMPFGGRLTLKTAHQLKSDHPDLPDGVRISVADTGEGIPSENIDRIFEPFFTTRPPGTGTGLGLSVSYAIVHDHGGMLEVESQMGNGSCFTIFLPLVPCTAQE
ncbi:MAG: GAF domain-containing protein [Anaerolineales bacterium]|jgi:two-component system, NtrC family, sensor kinase